MYCNVKCNSIASARRKGVMPLSEYVKTLDKGANHRFNCEVCNKQIYRTISSTNRKKGLINRFCSRVCMKVHNLKVRENNQPIKSAIILLKRKIKNEIDALKRIAKYVGKPKVFRVSCANCSGLFIAYRNGGLHKKVCILCRKETKKKNARIAKSRRKALERGVYSESIDPIKVFERDKWRCHLCGVKTIKALRGSYEPLSPELEHIIPLSVGGTHTYGNVACSCRACNIKKGNKIIGQVSLELFA
jgi:5-methylcytosine-specific restriction endonuclease McrA